jgi:hypothetical protein
MWRSAGRVVTVSLAAGVLLGCASGYVSGYVSLAGQQAAPLNMTWSSGLFGGTGKLSAVMGGGGTGECQTSKGAKIAAEF